MSKTNFQNLERSIATLVQDNQTKPQDFEQYLDRAIRWAKLAVSPPIFDQMSARRFTLDELAYRLARYSYRWGFDGITGALKTVSNDLAEMIEQKKATHEFTKFLP